MESQENSDSSSATSGCSGVTDTLAVSRNVQGTPDILAELRARASKKIDAAYEKMAEYQVMSIHHYGQWSYSYALFEVIEWLDELAPPSDNTVPDTTSGSAGVP